MILPGQPVQGQKISRARTDGGEDGPGGMPVEQTGAAPDAVAFMAAYSDARDGEGRTRSRQANGEPDGPRRDADSGGMPAARPGGFKGGFPSDADIARSQDRDGMAKVAAGDALAMPGASASEGARSTMPVGPDGTDPAAARSERAARNGMPGLGKAAQQPIAGPQSPASATALEGEDKTALRGADGSPPATAAKSATALAGGSTQASAIANDRSGLADAAPAAPGAPGNKDGDRAAPAAPREAPAAGKPAGDGAGRGPAQAATTPAGGPAAGNAPNLLDALPGRGTSGSGAEAGSSGSTPAPGQTAALQSGTGAKVPQGASQAPKGPGLPSDTGIAARPPVPGHGAPHPGRPGGVGQESSESAPGPRSIAGQGAAAPADGPRLPPAMASQNTLRDGGDAPPARAKDLPADLSPRIGPDSTARLDASRAGPAPAGLALPDVQVIAAPPSTTGQAAGAAEIPGTASSEAGPSPLAGSASIGGPSTTATGQTGAPLPQGGAQGMAQTAANQIVASLPRPVSELGTGALEVALDPPELGRVRLSLVEVAGAMTLSITAERPETAELMRRHLDLLAQEFARSGLDAPSVRVGAEGGGAQGHGPGADGEPGARAPSGPGLAESDSGLPLHPAQAPDPRRALDMRL
jgi:hypothetical protein